MAERGRKSPLGTHRWISSAERRETANFGHLMILQGRTERPLLEPIRLFRVPRAPLFMRLLQCDMTGESFGRRIYSKARQTSLSTGKSRVG